MNKQTITAVLIMTLLYSSTHNMLHPTRGHHWVSTLEILREIYVCKGKTVPLQAWSSPESSRKLRFPDYMITAQDSGKVVSLTHRPPLPPGNAPGTHFC